MRTRNVVRARRRYRIKKAWLARRADLDPKVVETALASNLKLRQLKEYHALTQEERVQRLKRAYLAANEPRARKKLEDLQALIDPVIDKLMDLDRKMRNAQSQLDVILYRANNIAGPTSYSLAREIRKMEMELKEGLMRQKLEYDQIEMRKLHDYWGPLNKKKREEDALVHQIARQKKGA